MDFDRKKIVLSLALALPGTMLGTIIILYELVKREIISENVALILMLLVVANVFYMMIRHVLSKKN